VTYVKNEEKSMSRFLNELFPKPNIVKQDFSSILLQNRFIQQNQDEIVLDIDLSKEQWSASKLKTYLSCRRKFYFQYLLNIKEHDISLEPKSYEIGNIIHKVLEDILKENPKYKYETLINELSMYQKESPYIAFELELWKKRLYKFYIKEQELQEFGLKPVAFEKFFKIVYNDITLTGRIDRLDSDERAKYHIYDYKTSKNLKIDTPKTYLNSTDFQLEFYYLASREFDVESVGYYDLYHGEIKKEVMLEEKLALLDKYLNELKTTQVSFDKCDTKSTCEYCPYKTICNR
jgi:ATP-dependent helicase/DNAse subunit B